VRGAELPCSEACLEYSSSISRLAPARAGVAGRKKSGHPTTGCPPSHKMRT
jgi:hypothetical protein